MAQTATPATAIPDLASMVRENTRRTRVVFETVPIIGVKRPLPDSGAQSSKEEPAAPRESRISIRQRAEYANVEQLPAALAAKLAAAGGPGQRKRPTANPGGVKGVGGGAGAAARARQPKLLEGAPPPAAGASTALVASRTKPTSAGAQQQPESETLALIRAQSVQSIKPTWHAPWKLTRVISGHLGWVRALAVEPDNKWFASGSGDRTIKIWDLATGRLRLTLTGHISTVRGLAVSPRHPYLFSCAEDKTVKCWDLETNRVIRHYHGHLSGVYSLSLHPTLDVLVTGGRDGAVRVWDMRSRANIHVLSGHTGTISDVVCQEADPQVISASLDSTVRLWDLAAGKTMGVLTHHKKGVRALAVHPTEFTFASGSTGSIKQWLCPKGQFMQNFEGHNSVINTLSVNGDNVMFSGGDNGSMSFWDWKSGHRFQALDTTAQPGSLDAESGIFTSTFDRSGLRLICGEADKTIKIWKPDPDANPETHPLDWQPGFQKKKF